MESGIIIQNFFQTIPFYIAIKV